MAEPRPIFGYWQTRGAGAHIRFLIYHLGIDVERVEYICGPAPDYDRSQWTTAKPNLGMVYPNLPYYIDDDVKMSEQLPILRQICRKYRPEYLGRTLKEQADLDMFSTIMKDSYMGKMIIPCYADNFEAEGRAAMVAHANEFLAKWMEFRGDYKYSIANDVTYIDFMAYEWLLRAEYLDPTIVSSVPKAVELKANLAALDGCEAYLKDASNRAFNNSMAKIGTSV